MDICVIMDVYVGVQLYATNTSATNNYMLQTTIWVQLYATNNNFGMQINLENNLYLSWGYNFGIIRPIAKNNFVKLFVVQDKDCYNPG